MVQVHVLARVWGLSPFFGTNVSSFLREIGKFSIYRALRGYRTSGLCPTVSPLPCKPPFSSTFFELNFLACGVIYFLSFPRKLHRITILMSTLLDEIIELATDNKQAAHSGAGKASYSHITLRMNVLIRHGESGTKRV